MMKLAPTQLLLLLALAFTACSPASDKAAEEQQATAGEQAYTGNPILPGNFADPHIIQHQDTFYIYATTGAEATVWRSADFVNWRLTKLNWPTSMQKPDIWAPGITQGKDGKFYLYTSTDHNIYAGVAEHPLGPFTNLLGGDSIFIENRQWWSKMHSIDADPFVDDDGQAYLYWGSGFDFKDGICAVGLLNDDMASFKKQPELVTPKGYFEGPHMMKRNDIYYLMYSDGLYYDSTYKVRYAMSDKPTGPFLQGKNSPILTATPDGKISGPGHHSTIKLQNDYYMVYHRHVYPFYKGIRQVCIDKMEFEEDGAIKRMVATQEGIPLGFAKATATRKQLQPVEVKTSGVVSSDYEADKAFDHNNGTLWAAPKTTAASWLQADLGEETTVKAVAPVFDEVMGNYDYKIESSSDGQTWSPYAAGNNAAAKEWPVEHQKEVKARFIRINITNNISNSERTGLWELKLF
ncbi:family 43 glycosylhydrolase [Pontibacter qinzhouensis]|uniref:Family 43 glycosylhydrolase n=1 Tax=Pontibacter qinzhouensis TaxID=2603253 RepID=A0A5C8KBG4_9BACT|nr:family 43 glycosylhydrolase [Pontibacter qinzhouensis]TXK49105.1 family 43 glycosylhydrolase [Pontibacter qinzhouensis]